MTFGAATGAKLGRFYADIGMMVQAAHVGIAKTGGP